MSIRYCGHCKTGVLLLDRLDRELRCLLCGRGIPVPTAPAVPTDWNGPDPEAPLPNAGTLKQMARARERAAGMVARYQAEVAGGASHMDAVRMVARSTGYSQRTVQRALQEVVT